MKNLKKEAKQDLIELLNPAIKNYFCKELNHSELTPVQMDSKSRFARRKSEQFSGVKYSKRQSWIVNLVNIINESIPSFNDLFDKETFYKFVFIVIIASILFVFLMVKVFKRCTVRKFLENFDCVVQAPTGSGKTLAYLLPTMHILNEKRPKAEAEKNNNGVCQIMALIVAPSRELVNQIHALFKPICKTLKFESIRLFGAGGSHKKRLKIGIKHFKGQCVLIATPGRIKSFLAQEPVLKNYLKYLEILIIDEADRYSDHESRRSLTTLLLILPKQRRTSLFSATQTTAMEELIKFGLRNPMRLNVSGGGKVEMDAKSIDQTIVEDELESGMNGVPKELTNYYACVPADRKFMAMLKFLKSQKNAKILCFVSNAAQSEYFSLIVPPLLEDSERLVLSLHRKMEQKRQKILEQFRSTKHSILFATDILARGVDVVDIDWVMQYDIPKLSNIFIHRSGRSGRMGREGKCLLLLMEEESGYVEFIQKHEKIKLEESEFGNLKMEKAEVVRQKIQQMAIEDRKILELSSSAFISSIEAYNRHDSQIVCKVKDLNIPGIANSFGLLRLPRIRELNGRKDLGEFRPRMDINTSEIKFKEQKLEEKRQKEKILKKSPNSVAVNKKIKFEKDEERKEEMDEEEEKPKIKKKNKRKMPEWEQLGKEVKLIKKFKKGKLSREELHNELDEI